MDATLTLVMVLVGVGVLLALWAQRQARRRPPTRPRHRAPVRPRRERTSEDRVQQPLPPPTSEIPRAVSRPRPHVPSPVGRAGSSHPPVGEAPDEPPRTWAERFELPPAVTAVLDDPDDPVAIVQALLVAAGRPVEVHGEVLRSGEHFLAVIGAPGGRPVQPKVMGDLFLRFRASGATDGVVICMRHLDPRDVRRREMLAPELLHEGPDAVQRMADAVREGDDPLAALGMVVSA